MRKTRGFVALALLAFTAACGSNKSETGAQSSSAKPATVATGKASASASASAQAKPPPLKKGILPAGATLVTEAQKKGEHVGEPGIGVSLVMSATDDPVLAFIDKDPDEKLTLRFASWDRDAGKWKGPTTVDTISELAGSATQLEIARDKSSSALGIAYRKNEKEVWLAMSSDAGSTWKTEKLPSSGGTLNGVSIALAKGGQFVAFNDGANVKLLSRFAATGDFKAENAPLVGDGGSAKGADVSVKTDSEGKPGLLYGLAPKDAYNTTIAFWRPGDPTASKVVDSNNIQNDALHLSLGFAGAKPRAAVNLSRGGGEKSSTYFVTSDDGKEWAAPINVLPDGGNGMDGFMSLAVTENAAPRPEVEAIVMPVTGGNNDGTKCGEPKLARMSDTKSFTTCSPDTDRALGFKAPWAAAAFDEKGRLYLAFVNRSADAKMPLGLFVWRE